MHILVGTSGYSYQDWKGPFYPPRIAARDMVAFYARRFRTVEINFTYYRFPDSRTIAAIVSKAPSLTYAVKVPGDITHGGDATPGAADKLLAGVAPMSDAGVLGCLLAQFPYGFRHTTAAVEFLRRLAGNFAGQILVAEFRHVSWATAEAWQELATLGIGFCNVDEPALKGLMPATAAVTSDVAYFRFHGRNSAKWFRHREASERYNYLYNREELQPWVERIKLTAAKAQKTFVFMNNHPLGHAVTNAQMLIEMLGLEPEPEDAALF